MYAPPTNAIGAYNVVHQQAPPQAAMGRGWAAQGYPAGTQGGFPAIAQQQPMFRGGFQQLAPGYPSPYPGVAPQGYPQQMAMWGAPTGYAPAQQIGGRGYGPDRGGRGMMHGGFRGGYGAPGFPARARGKKVWHGGTLESQKAWERSTLCCFYLQGMCKFNEMCRFSHEDDQKRPCQFGTNCRVGHAIRAEGEGQGEMSPEAMHQQQQQQMDQTQPESESPPPEPAAEEAPSA